MNNYQIKYLNLLKECQTLLRDNKKLQERISSISVEIEKLKELLVDTLNKQPKKTKKETPVVTDDTTSL